MEIDYKNFTALKRMLKTPEDDAVICKNYGITRLQAARIRNSENFREYCERIRPKKSPEDIAAMEREAKAIQEARREAMATSRMVGIVGLFGFFWLIVIISLTIAGRN